MLFLLPVLQEAQRARPALPSLNARLAKPPAPEPEPPTLPPAVQPAIRPRPAPAAKTAPQPSPVPPPRIAGIEPAKPAADPAFVVPAGPAAPAPVAPAAAAAAASASASQPGAAASGPDPGTVARYRLELMDLARRYKKYPRIAQENNWQGRVELRIEIGADGALASLSVKKGAGRAVLDEAAQTMLRTASSMAAIPPALRGKAFSLEIPVDFFLKDDER